MSGIIVVGGGLAAARAVESLRDSGYADRLVVVADEHHLPYERPPLSKGYLLGDEAIDSAFTHPPEWYVERDVDLRLGTSASSIDLDAHVVTLRDEQLGYDRLLLATGASPRRLAAADDSGAAVAYLRTIEDSDRLKAALQPGRRIVVVGAGWIGLEVAAAARTAGCEVEVVEALDKPLLRVLGPEVGDVFQALHESQGVRFHLGASVESVSRDGGRGAVHLGDGSAVEADLLVVGVGVAPNTGLAEAAGLEVDNGIVTDAHLRTSHPDVFAAGDVANAYHPRLGRHVRVEHWDNAGEQGRAAALNMLGADAPYDRLPYFFTDQYDVGMEYVGHVGPDGYDDVVLRGDVRGRTFTAFWLQDQQVVAGMHVNDWDAIDPIRGIVAAGEVDLAGLRDASVSLAELTY